MTVELTKKKTPRKASVAPDDGTDVLSDMAQAATHSGKTLCCAGAWHARGPRSAQPRCRTETATARSGERERFACVLSWRGAAGRHAFKTHGAAAASAHGRCVQDAYNTSELHRASAHEMFPFRMRFTVTGPAEVSMATSFHAAAPAALVRRSGCTASQIFFFCTLQAAGVGSVRAHHRSASRQPHLFSESGPVCGASPKRTRSPTFASAGGDSCVERGA